MLYQMLSINTGSLFQKQKDTFGIIRKQDIKEAKTSKYMADIFEGFGYELIMAEDIPDFYTTVDTGAVDQRF